MGAGREALGCVDELLLDLDSGQVAFAILSCGGVMGVGGRRLVVPWRWLRYEPGLQRFVLTVERRSLDGAVALGHDDWPDFSDGRLQRRLADFYDDSAHRPRPELPPTH